MANRIMLNENILITEQEQSRKIATEAKSRAFKKGICML